MSYRTMNLVVIALLLLVTIHTREYLISSISIVAQITMLLLFEKYKESITVLLNYVVQSLSLVTVVKDFLSLMISSLTIMIAVVQLNKGLSEARQRTLS